MNYVTVNQLPGILQCSESKIRRHCLKIGIKFVDRQTTWLEKEDVYRLCINIHNKVSDNMRLDIEAVFHAFGHSEKINLIPARKETPIKYCLYCGEKMERIRFKSNRVGYSKGRLEDLNAFKKRKLCSMECRESYEKEIRDKKKIQKDKEREQRRKERQLTKYNVFDRYPVKKLDNGCWIVENISKKYEGYYSVNRKINGKNVNGLHRIVYYLFNGDIPKGMCVCHSCNNTSCVHPNHLYAGTRKDNTQDMIKSNRNAKRKGNKQVLSNQDIIDIKNSSLSSYQLAEVYPVTPTHIRRIKNGSRCNNINKK